MITIKQIIIFFIIIGINVGIGIYILSLSITLMNKIKKKTETNEELQSLKNNLQQWIFIDLFACIVSIYNRIRNFSNTKINKILLTIDVLQCMITITYFFILSELVSIYKNKKYDKSLTYVRILVIFDIVSVICGIITSVADVANNVNKKL